MYLRLEQTGDENRVLPGRRSLTWCENLIILATH